jgi:hypothetical protein
MGWIPKLRELLKNMREPIIPEQKKLWNELKQHDENPKLTKKDEWKKLDSAQIIWFKLVEYSTYFGQTFNYTTETIKNGKNVTLPAAVMMNGELYLTGGNRRMTYFCLNKVLPVVWTWNQ